MSQVRRLSTIALLCFLSACGLGDMFSSSSSSATATDAGMCPRNIEALNDLLVHPKACVSDDQCPTGSSCDLSSGACDWTCISDSDCGATGPCSCNGRC